MTAQPAPGTAEVETYYLDGRWHTRRGDSEKPFASGVSRERMIAIGVEVARWNGFRHVIRDVAGSVVEVSSYDTRAAVR
ncbi:hypothetical protein [Kribbella solani]|uniref:DUF2188 domain-containing protein n=1 Tax=Kribbella solani TaxID=236067 RepID=A0A841DIX0_9ACTN|nr:hypothetical protein [Kribbella solani]MBB5978452.1 hypothetical protein [Kribbella solani]